MVDSAFSNQCHPDFFTQLWTYGRRFGFEPASSARAGDGGHLLHR